MWGVALSLASADCMQVLSRRMHWLNGFGKSTTPQKLSTYCILLLVKTISWHFCGWVDFPKSFNQYIVWDMVVAPSASHQTTDPASWCKFHVGTLAIYKLDCNQNYYTFSLMLLSNTVLHSKLCWTKFMGNKCFRMKLCSEAEIPKVDFAPMCSVNFASYSNQVAVKVNHKYSRALFAPACWASGGCRAVLSCIKCV